MKRITKKRKYVQKSPAEREINRLLKAMPPKRAKRKIAAVLQVLLN